MQILVAIFLLTIAVTLLWAWRTHKISNETLNAVAAILTVIAGMAAIVLFIVPAASPQSPPTETSTPEIEVTNSLTNTTMIGKTPAPSETVTVLAVQPSAPSPISTYPEDCFGYEMVQDWLQAEECYKQKIIANPYDFEALDNLARVYGVNGQHAESIKIAQNMMWLADNAEEHLEAIETLGVQQYYLGDYASAINTLLKGADYYDSQNPRSVEISLWLARSYDANGDKKKACEQYQSTLTLAQQQNYGWGIENAQSGLSSCH